MNMTSSDVQSVKKIKRKKERNSRIYFNTNYRTEMKLVPVIMDHCLLQFEALKFFLERLHGQLFLLFSM